MGGAVTIVSTPGVGSTFTFTFRYASKPIEQAVLLNEIHRVMSLSAGLAPEMRGSDAGKFRISA